MSPIVAALLATLVCATPPPTFREFYRDHYFAAEPGRFWAAIPPESVQSVVTRVLEATADYQDYRAGRLDRCGRDR